MADLGKLMEALAKAAETDVSMGDEGIK